MFNTSCPACGAPVSFRSAASVMAVCGYCNSTLLKEADAVRDLGKMGVVLEDYSRIQIATTGHIDGGRFTVVGRIQLRYDDGFWNEWYVLFDDGSNGWLSDASGQQVFTRAFTGNPRVPGFEQFHPGKVLVHEGKSFFASDVCKAQCTAGEGELPFQVGAGYELKAVDLRCAGEFMTIDYSDGDTPQQYIGRAVTLDELQCQLLRDNDSIKEKAGNYRGKIQPLDCPSCGTSIPYVPGLATQLVCPSCHTGIDSSGPKAEALMSLEAQQKHEPTLPLGATGMLDGVEWQVLGAMAVTDDEEVWGEYLLFNVQAGFLWLIELADGSWQRARVLNAWPEHWVNSTARVEGSNYQMMYRYQAHVLYAIGAFNWRVKAGDTQTNVDYACGQQHLSMERTEQEITWSLCLPQDGKALLAAFGHNQGHWLSGFGLRSRGAGAAMPTGNSYTASGNYAPTAGTSLGSSGSDLMPIAKIFSFILILANVAYLGSSMGVIAMIVGLAMLWLPLLGEVLS